MGFLYLGYCQAIGTVHAFQGKQALAVFFVLGGDKSTLGAIDWASSKPNLLNFAVTSARSRFYMIGDYELWKNWPYFEVAAKQLTRGKLNLSPIKKINFLFLPSKFFIFQIFLKNRVEELISSLLNDPKIILPCFQVVQNGAIVRIAPVSLILMARLIIFNL